MYKLIEYQLITEYTKKDALPELEEPLFRQKLVVFSGAGISVEREYRLIGIVAANGC